MRDIVSYHIQFQLLECTLNTQWSFSEVLALHHSVVWCHMTRSWYCNSWPGRDILVVQQLQFKPTSRPHVGLMALEWSNYFRALLLSSKKYLQITFQVTPMKKYNFDIKICFNLFYTFSHISSYPSDLVLHPLNTKVTPFCMKKKKSVKMIQEQEISFHR